MASHNWLRFNGQIIATSGRSLLDLPLMDGLSALYYLAVKGGREEDVRKFDSRLWMPPKGVRADPRSPWSAENETAAFQAVKAMVSGKGPTPKPAGSPS